MRYLKTTGAVALWVLQILAALAFAAIGFGKFVNPFWIRSFAKWGYSDSFRMLIGVVEMAGGVLLAFPQTAIYAATVIDLVMIGALGTLWLNSEPRGHLFAPIFWMLIVSGIAYGRRRRTWRPVGRSASVAVDPV